MDVLISGHTHKVKTVYYVHVYNVQVSTSANGQKEAWNVNNVLIVFDT